MKRLVFTAALTCGVLMACCAAEAQADHPWNKPDPSSQFNNPQAMASMNHTPPSPSTPLQLIPVTPCRVVDTRGPDGRFGGPPIQGGTFRSFPIPQGSCSIPSTAAAYSLNVFVIPQARLSYLTVYPTGEDRGLVTTINARDGFIKAHAAIVPAGTDEAVSVYASDTTDVVLDIDGYFAPASGSALEFYPLTPCRAVDTRNGQYLQGGQERDFPLLQSSCSIPANAVAYSLNLTALPRTGFLGFLSVWPAGQEQPMVATLVDATGTVVSNAAIVPAGTGGAIAVYPSDDTDLIIDINGFFAAPGAGGLSLYPTAQPCHAFDTRKSVFGFSGQIAVPVGISGHPCGLPGTARAFVFNATVYPQSSLNYLTLWADGEPRPTTWILSAVDGAVTSNMAIVGTTNGYIDAYAAGTTHLVLDISSYFAP